MDFITFFLLCWVFVSTCFFFWHIAKSHTPAGNRKLAASVIVSIVYTGIILGLSYVLWLIITT